MKHQITPERAAQRNQLFSPPSMYKTIFFKITFLKMKEIPGAAWAQCEAGVEGVGDDHGIQDTKQPQIPLSEEFACSVLCFEIVTFKCFSFKNVKRMVKV